MSRRIKLLLGALALSAIVPLGTWEAAASGTGRSTPDAIQADPHVCC